MPFSQKLLFGPHDFLCKSSSLDSDGYHYRISFALVPFYLGLKGALHAQSAAQISILVSYSVCITRHYYPISSIQYLIPEFNKHFFLEGLGHLLRPAPSYCAEIAASLTSPNLLQELNLLNVGILFEQFRFKQLDGSFSTSFHSYCRLFSFWSLPSSWLSYHDSYLTICIAYVANYTHTQYFFNYIANFFPLPSPGCIIFLFCRVYKSNCWFFWF